MRNAFFSIFLIFLSFSPLLEANTSNNELGDLQIVEIEVIKQKKNFVCVKYTIKNVGNAVLNILGPSDKKNDNLTLRVYLSGDKEFGKGDVLLDGGYVENNLLPNGKLHPGKSFNGELKVDLRLKSNFQNVLIFKVDDFKTIPESDEWNNTYAVVL